MTCPVCRAAGPRPKLRVDGVPILECVACGLAWWVPDESFRVEQVYDGTYFSGTHEGRGYDDYASLETSLRRTFARRLARLPGPRAGGRLLDVGAAYGFAVAEAQRAGWRAAGLELSRDAARHAARATGGHVAVASGSRAPFAPESFEAVTLWDVLEHLPEPHAAIAEIARLLRPGGWLALTTGDVESLAARLSGPRWHLYNLPEHLFFYTRRSLERLLASHGLEVRSMRAEGALYTLGYLAERLRKTVLGRPTTSSPRFPGSTLTLPVNLFDILTVHATKPKRGRA